MRTEAQEAKTAAAAATAEATKLRGQAAMLAERLKAAEAAAAAGEDANK